MEAKKIKKYGIVEEEQFATVGEPSMASQQYANDLRYGMEVLSKVSPEMLHHIVVLLSNYAESELGDMPNEVTKAAVLEAKHLHDKGSSSAQPVDTSSVEAMLSSCGI